MATTLEDILCSDPWVWDSDGSCQITFHSNGTGELICRSELSVFIATEIDWELAPSSSASNSTTALTAISLDPSSSTHLATLSLKIRLSSRRIASFGARKMNEDLLHESAFEMKTYTVKLECGDFTATADARYYATSKRTAPGYSPRFSLKLVFDPSPYPPPECWKNPNEGPVSFKVWEFNEFCSRRSGTVADRDQGLSWNKMLSGLMGKSSGG
ncbi:hypothetical protein GGR57DRAFT_505383 [Xylariaceae sp. FL1272]|nr:hypothetical protein GGR57DRAFT_505383 [Xylariaceae sp. FL1272]